MVSCGFPGLKEKISSIYECTDYRASLLFLELKDNVCIETIWKFANNEEEIKVGTGENL